MFSSKRYLQKKTGPDGVGRLGFLQELVEEFQSSETQAEHKLQVLANLANFAYDPVNYEFLRQLNVMDLFLDCLAETDPTMKRFAIGGLCNLALDKPNKEYILKNDGVKLVIACLSSSDEETVLTAITTMMFLMCPESKKELTSISVVDAMLRMSSSNNPRLRNLASIYVSDYCTPSHIEQALTAQEQWDRQAAAATAASASDHLTSSSVG